MNFKPGSLVKARGREWVVLPGTNDDLVLVRPLGGTDSESTGIMRKLEAIEPATFPLPEPGDVGDHRSCEMMRNAMRLTTRWTTGPFRSFGRISFEPRPYQLVPLLMALKLNPVRLLIADDVGIGKTIEASLIAKELLDRGEIKRLAILCPPQLAEQWRSELMEKFHIDAKLVLPSTAAKLEKNCFVGQSLFDVHPHVIVSLDFIKSDRRREEFVRSCPEFVIVDEAHTCAYSNKRGGRHQRYELIKRLSQSAERHLVLVTATPHSGNEEAFRSLLSLLDPGFANLPEDLSGEQNRKLREMLAKHLVQRRRADLRKFMEVDTPFPNRFEPGGQDGLNYSLSPEYKKLFGKAIRYAKEMVDDTSGEKRHQRIRWYSAVALLRSLASSPAAAAATLRNRAQTMVLESVEDIDAIGQKSILDLDIDDEVEGMDLTPGSLIDECNSSSRQLLDMAKEADILRGENDHKLVKATQLLKNLLNDGFNPIVFCRFIPTADYLCDELRKRLSGVEIASVTGELPSDERKARVATLSEAERRILVCTDCLSEGINLQEHFDAVFHYDLAWNPTRHEQRSGRVDRFGQPRDDVRVITYWGKDTQIDGVILQVLIRKHHAIRSSLGISIPVPMNSNEVIEAILEGLLLKTGGDLQQKQLSDFIPEIDSVKQKADDLHIKWENAAEREKKSRTLFAQESIKVEEVSNELKHSRSGIGGSKDVERFFLDALKQYGASVNKKKGMYEIGLEDCDQSVKDIFHAGGTKERFEVHFEPIGVQGSQYLDRTHPFVENIASLVVDGSLDSELHGIAKRSGVIRTKDVEKRMTALLIRFRFQVDVITSNSENSILAEESVLMGFSGAPESAEWLLEEDVVRLTDLKPTANTSNDTSRAFISKVLSGQDYLFNKVEEEAKRRADVLLESHRRVRTASNMTGVKYNVKPLLPADIIGVYVYLPDANEVCL